MSVVDVETLALILREAAKEEILPRFRRLEQGDIRTKGEAIDLVTEADVRAERLIKARVADLAPAALFVGEESVAADPALLDRLNEADLAIVVDPVDGTANFAAGLPLFAVMAAVVHRGEAVAGIIYDPMGDDWVMAEKGSGAFLKRPDGPTERLHTRPAPPVSQMVGTVSLAFLAPESKALILQNLAKIRVPANYRVAGHEYRLLAGGHTSFSFYNKLMPWDHLAGTLIIAEAGGHVAQLDGSTYGPRSRTGGLLCAGDRETWDMLRREVFTQ